PAPAPSREGGGRPLAVPSRQRLPPYPDVPTRAGGGIKDMEVEFWQGLVAPAATPKPVIARLERELIAIAKLPDFRDKLAAQEMFPVGSTAQEFGGLIARELVQSADVAEQGNIKIE